LKNNLKKIVLLISLAIIGLVVIQVIWINNAIELKKSEFDHSVSTALVSVSNKIPLVVSVNKQQQNFGQQQKYQNGFNGIDAVVKDIFNNAPFESPSKKISPKQLDSLINLEFLRRGINTPYEFGVYNSAGQAYFLKDSNSFKYNDLILNEGLNIQIFVDDYFNNGVFLSVFFPKKNSFIFKRMWIILSISLLLILAVIYAFYYTVNTIQKQKKVSEIKNDFINNMTHELKTPISTIQLACEALMDSDMQQPESKEAFVNIINQENKRLGSLVETVLKTAILDQGKLHLNYEKFDLLEQINKVVNNFALKIKQEKGVISVNTQLIQMLIEGDSQHLTNVFQNLIDNAIKYAKEAPIIEITAIKTNESFIVKVKDNGIGINKENQAKIFDKLYRVPTGDVHNVKGFGLGLNYVKSIVEKHGGNVSVKSALGKGSTFKIILPINKTEELH
jgi:two-component system phosphate regulon sensor histidine kinase PhoR